MKFMDLGIGFEARKDAIHARVASILSRTQFIFGAECEELEQELASYTGTTHALGTASGTDALVLALMAMGITPQNDNREKEVIVPAYTFIATAEAVAFLGAKVVFCDIDERTYNIDTASLNNAITDKTVGIIPVNLFGQCADYSAIANVIGDRDIFVLEDACQSFGATYHGKQSCSLGRVGVTSFFPAKPLGGAGDGGMLFTNDDEIAEQVKRLRHHGDAGGMNHVAIGMTGRLDNLQAGILLEKRKGLEDDLAKRADAATYYTDGLKDAVVTPLILEGNTSVYAQYCVRSQKRDVVMNALNEKEIPTPVYYKRPLHLMPCFKDLGYTEGDMPVSERVSNEIFALPMYPEIPRQDQDVVIEIITHALG